MHLATFLYVVRAHLGLTTTRDVFELATRPRHEFSNPLCVGLPKNKSRTMAQIDALLQQGPLNGDHIAGLDELRRIVLLDGIPSNSDGMVSRMPLNIGKYRLANVQPVRVAHLCLADTSERPTAADKDVPRPGGGRRITSICQNQERHLPDNDY